MEALQYKNSSHYEKQTKQYYNKFLGFIVQVQLGLPLARAIAHVSPHQ